MSWNGLMTSPMSVDSNMLSITERDISVTRSKAITDRAEQNRTGKSLSKTLLDWEYYQNYDVM